MTIPKFSPNRVRPDEAPELVASRNFEALATIVSAQNGAIEEHSGLLAGIAKRIAQWVYPAFQGFSLRSSGAAPRIGRATLVAGTVTIANTSVTATDIPIPFRITAGGTLGHLSCTVVAGTSITITSSSATDVSSVGYLLIGVF